MTTQRTYNRLKDMIESDKFDYALKVFREFEAVGLALGGKDYTEEQLIPFIENLKFPKVENKIIANPDDYEELFDDMIYDTLRIMCIAKGIELSSSSELLVDIRDSIIRHADNYHMDLTVPYKEYSLGDKVSLYYDGVPFQATIIDVGAKKGYGWYEYGLLIDGKYKLVYVEESDSPTNYIIELQKRINVE